MNLLLQTDGLLLLFQTLFLLRNSLLLEVHGVILRVDLVLESRDWARGAGQAVSNASVNAGSRWLVAEADREFIHGVRARGDYQRLVGAKFAAAKRGHVLAKRHPVLVHLLLQRHVLLLCRESLLLRLESLLLVAHGKLLGTDLGLESRARAVSTSGGECLAKVVLAKGLAILVDLLLQGYIFLLSLESRLLGLNPLLFFAYDALLRTDLAVKSPTRLKQFIVFEVARLELKLIAKIAGVEPKLGIK